MFDLGKDHRDFVLRSVVAGASLMRQLGDSPWGWGRPAEGKLWSEETWRAALRSPRKEGQSYSVQDSAAEALIQMQIQEIKNLFKERLINDSEAVELH